MNNRIKKSKKNKIIVIVILGIVFLLTLIIIIYYLTRPVKKWIDQKETDIYYQSISNDSIPNTSKITFHNFSNWKKLFNYHINGGTDNDYKITETNKTIEIHITNAVDTELNIEINNIKTSTPTQFNIYLHSSVDDYVKANNFISQRSFSIIGTNGKISSTNHNVEATGWIYKHIDNYKYYLITNFHVYVDFSNEKCNHFYYSNINNKVINYANYTEFTSFIPKTSGDPQIGENYISDTFMYEVDFGNVLGEFKTNLDNLNNYCDSHTHYSFVPYDWSDTNPTYYIGGYPLQDKYKFNFKYIFQPTRYEEYHGYANTYDKGNNEYFNISHNVKKGNIKYKSVDNDIIMQANTCNTLGSGSSGSLCVVCENHEIYLIGINWGGWNMTFSSDNIYYFNKPSMFLNAIACLTEVPTNLNNDFPYFSTNFSYQNLFHNI